MTRRVLVHLFHPGNALGGMCSVLGLGRAEGLPEAEVTVLLSNPCADPQALPVMAETVYRLSAGQGWKKPVILGEEDMRAILDGQAPDSPGPAGRFRRFLAERGATDQFDEIHYVHEVSGPLFRLALAANPTARAVTFGDALGSLNNAGYHAALYDGRPAAECEAAGRAYAQAAAGGRIPQARTVVALLPTDQTGDCLAGKRLIVVPRQAALEVIASARPWLDDLKAHCASLVAAVPAPRFLCLMETVDQSGFASRENALALQQEIIARAAPEGAGIIIKPHPLSSSGLHLELAGRLRAKFAPVCVGEAYWRYPVEFMHQFLGDCRPVCWSYGTLSLSYLLDTPLEHAIDEDLVRRYMLPKHWRSMFDSMRLVTAPLERLRTWDRTGPLWSGRYETTTEKPA